MLIFSTLGRKKIASIALAKIDAGQKISRSEFEALKVAPNRIKLPLEYSDYLATVSESESSDNVIDAKASPKLQEETKLSQPLPPLSVLRSAKIALQVVENFDSEQILSVSEFLSADEFEQGLQDLNEEMTPKYERLLLGYYRENLGITKISAEDLKPQLVICMRQGLRAIRNTEVIETLILSKNEDPSTASTIAKKRSWSELKAKTELE